MLKQLLFAILLIWSLSAPAEQPRHYGFGRTPSAAEIKQWDIDIMPDGRQLPPGSGSVARGKEIYQSRCLACHGKEGKGGPNDRLVGNYNPDINFTRDTQTTRTIGNYWPYATTLYDYINRAMPFTNPGSLKPDAVYSLVAYLLFLNGIIDQDTVLDAATLPRVVMPARHLFYWSDEVK